MERQNPKNMRERTPETMRGEETGEEQFIEEETLEETQPLPEERLTLQKPLGILFDLGDTLLTHLGFDPEAGHAATLKIADNPLGYTVTDIDTHIKELNRDLIPRREKAQVEFHPHIIQRHVYEALHITFDRTPEEVERTFWRAAMSWQPEPGIEYVLEILRDKNIPMGIVSNAAFCGNTLMWEIEQQGIADYFRFSCPAPTTGSANPIPSCWKPPPPNSASNPPTYGMWATRRNTISQPRTTPAWVPYGTTVWTPHSMDPIPMSKSKAGANF